MPRGVGRRRAILAFAGLALVALTAWYAYSHTGPEGLGQGSLGSTTDAAYGRDQTRDKQLAELVAPLDHEGREEPDIREVDAVSTVEPSVVSDLVQTSPDADPPLYGAEPWEQGERLGGKTPNSVFELKYADASASEIREAFDKVSREAKTLRESIFEERYSLGLYEERVSDPDEGYSVTIRSDKPTARVMSGPPVAPGVAHILWIPFDEHGDYYALKDEYGWLGSVVNNGSLFKSGSGPK